METRRDLNGARTSGQRVDPRDRSSPALELNGYEHIVSVTGNGFWATTVPLSPGRGHVYIHVPTADYIAFSSIIHGQLNLSFWSHNDLRPHDFRGQLDMRLRGNHFFLGGQAGQQPMGPTSLSASGPKRSLSETHRRSWLIWQSEEMAWGQRKQDVCGWLSVGG